MKDELIALVEAVRLARLEIQCFRDPNCRASEKWTLNRLAELLESEDVSRAMAALAPDEEQSPSILPDDTPAGLRVPNPSVTGEETMMVDGVDVERRILKRMQKLWIEDNRNREMETYREEARLIVATEDTLSTTPSRSRNPSPLSPSAIWENFQR